MILPDFVLPSQVNQHWKYSGLDSPDLCLDKKHFNSYPYTGVIYYNNKQVNAPLMSAWMVQATTG